MTNTTRYRKPDSYYNFNDKVTMNKQINYRKQGIGPLASIKSLSFSATM